eukprot:s3646_g12.t1
MTHLTGSALVQERPVLCKDLASGQKLLESNCSGSKPDTTRILCPATAPCPVATSTSTTTTTPTTSLTCCPKGFTLKSPSELPLSCLQGTCEVEACCSMTKWVYDDWDETPECDQSCGLAEQIQERSVSCQAVYGGELLMPGWKSAMELPRKAQGPQIKDLDSQLLASGEVKENDEGNNTAG